MTEQKVSKLTPSVCSINRGNKFFKPSILALLVCGLVWNTSSYAANDWTDFGGVVAIDADSNTEGTNIALGKGAKAFIGQGRQEGILAFGQQDSGNRPTTEGVKNLPETIAIGTNVLARTGSVVIGSHSLRANLRMGDVADASKMQSFGIANTTVGTNSLANGPFATTFGSYNIQSSGYDGSGFFNTLRHVSKNAFATVIGNFNSNESFSGDSTSGVGNFIGGVGNKVSNSNGSLVLGGGNKVSNSYVSLSGLSGLISKKTSSPGELQDEMLTALKSNQGGSALVLGSGNELSNTTFSQVFGVQNTVTGTNNKNLSVSGVKNTVNKSSNVMLSGVNSTVENTTNAVSFGSNHTLSGANDTIAFGFYSKATTTSAQQAVILGSEANATVNGGVALGYKSIASTDKGIAGYDPETGATSTKTTDATWTSTAGAVSVGDTTNNLTRQITGVAAGTADTDAVNVAQLKAALKKAMENQSNGGDNKKVTVSAGDSNINVTPSEKDDTTDYAVSLNKEKIEVGTDPTKDKVTIDGDNSTITAGTGDKQVVINGKDGTVTAGTGDKQVVLSGQNGTVTAGAGDKQVVINGKDGTVTAGTGDKQVVLSGQNGTVTAGAGDKQVVINGKDGTVTAGTGDKQVVLSGQNGTVTAGAGDNKVVIDGNKGNVTIGGAINLNGQNGNANFGDNIAFNGQTGGANFGSVTINQGGKGTVGGLTNTTWNPNNYVSGQAATEDQLYQATQAQNNQYRELKRDIADLDDDIRDAGAAAAALAGLKPVQYDPVQPTQLMAAIGGYRGSVALSLGIGHYTSERMLWHAGVAMNEHPMFNVGFTFKFGNRKLKDANDREYPIHDRYKAGPITASYVMQRDLSGDLDQHNGLIDDVNALKAKDAKVEALEAEVAQLREELKEFKELLKKGKMK